MADDFGTVIGVAFFLLCMAYAAHIEWEGQKYRRRAAERERARKGEHEPQETTRP